MRARLVVALFALVCTATAEETQSTTDRGASWVSGKENPDAIPEWSALDAMLGAAVRSSDPEGLLQALTKVSELGAAALIEYRRSQEASLER